MTLNGLEGRVKQPLYDSEYLGDYDTRFFSCPLGQSFQHAYPSQKNYGDTNIEQSSMIPCGFGSYTVQGISLSHGVIPEKLKSKYDADYLYGWPLAVLDRGWFELQLNNRLGPRVPLAAIIRSDFECAKHFRESVARIIPAISSMDRAERSHAIERLWNDAQKDCGGYLSFFEYSAKIHCTECVSARIIFPFSKQFGSQENRMLVTCILHGYGTERF